MSDLNVNSNSWMTLEEAADYLRCSVRYLKEIVSNREIPFTMLAGKALFHKSKIDEWMFSKEERVKPTQGNASESTDSSKDISPNCNREKVDALIRQLIDFNELFVTGLGNNLKSDLEDSSYQRLSEKVYAQLSRWCHPKRNTRREQQVKVIAHQISELLYGQVISRTKHPSYYG